ncbi:MAG: sporulation protein YqfD, partial [Alicyclobacillus sp.]|nr:sporulation protein YqfD [Alicyclobacillus sp.]
VVENVPGNSQAAAQPHHVVAGKPGVVRKVFAERGQALVKPGQVVHSGQVLISGALAGGAVHVPAAGRVWAEVWYTSRVEVPLQVRWNGLTGVRSERDYLVIGPWAVHVWGWDPPFTTAFTQDQETDWQLAGRSLPVQWRREMVYQAQTQDWQASVTDARARALQLALQDVQRHMQADGSLLGQSVLQWQVNHGKLYATVLTRTEEDIGVPAPIPPESEASSAR